MQVFRTLKIAILCIIALCNIFIADFARAQDTNIPIIERPDTEFLILGLEINGYSRSQGIEAYLPSGASPEDVLIPLQDLVDALSAKIEVDPGAGTAEGFYLKEDHIFTLNASRQEVISARATYNLTLGDVESHTDDIYVRSSQLEKWFNLDIDLESSSLILYIDSDAVFPFEAAGARKKRAQKLLVKSRRADFNPEDAYLVPYGLYSQPSFLLQQSVFGSTTRENNTVQSNANVQAGFDLLRFGADLNLSYAVDNNDQNEFTNARLTFSRSDPRKTMMGGLNAGRIDVGDINFSPVPLFVGAQRGAGVRISSEADFGFRVSQQLGKILIDGDAPVNWDVELYRNGQFIDFQTISNDARYEFVDVTLINGFNRFKILLFGPEGQTESFTRDIFSGPNMLADGQMRYNLSAGLPQSDFLPLVEDRRNDKTFGSSGEISYGLNNFLTVGGNFYQGPIDDDTASSVGLNATASFFGFNAQVQGLRASEDRSAYQASLRNRFFGINTALTHTIFSNFEEDDQDIEKSTELSFSRSFGRLNVTLLAENQKFLEEEDRTILESIISSDIAGVKFTNELTKTISDNDSVDDLEGEISAFKEYRDIRFRTSLSYDLDTEAVDTFRSFRLSAQKKLREYESLRLTSTYDFPSDILSGNLRYSREYGPVTLDFDVGGNTDQNYFAGMTVRTSLQPSKTGYEFVQPRIGSLAQLEVQAFVDENSNEIYDEGEQPLENIVFKTARGKATALSDADGLAYMNGLAETPTRIYVSQEDIPSIYLMPAKKGLDLIPRRGAEGVVDFPFTQLGEIDGFILNSADDTPLSNIPVRVVNADTGEEVAKMNSEYDGYYVFTALPIGDYEVMASQGWFDEDDLGIVSKLATISVQEPNALDINLYFDVTTNEFAEKSLSTEQLIMPHKRDMSQKLDLPTKVEDMNKSKIGSLLETMLKK